MPAPGPLGRRLARLIGRVASGVVSGARRTPSAPAPAPDTTPAPTPARSAQSAVDDLVISYAPHADGRPDPGEVVWAWVPFEEDPAKGKDRPVLVLGRAGGDLVGLMLTSKDHDRDAEQEAHWGRYWMDVGSGAWDARRRPSEVRLDRLLRIDPDGVRREGAALDRAVFDRVVAAVRARRGQ